MTKRQIRDQLENLCDALMINRMPMAEREVPNVSRAAFILGALMREITLDASRESEEEKRAALQNGDPVS